MPPFPDDAIVRRAMRRLGSALAGRYSISRLIGIGGMAAVYAGVHRNGHAVAIKILHEGLASDPEIERLFRREAQLANKVDHPGVVPVIDDDVTEDGCVFLVMPMLHGETLRARAERQGRKLPVEEVVVVAHAVLEVLAAAHGKKIVHRDIKPENLFVTKSGDVKVLDFGIGRFFQTNDATSATRSGRALGTPAFMAPEQALGRLREVDGRTDLWAVGATMFALLSGRFVHDAENPAEITVLAATRPAQALAKVVPQMAGPLGDVVDRALAFQRDARWPDAEAMAHALQQACEVALGRPLADLPRVTAPVGNSIDELDALPTHSPSSVALAERWGTVLHEPTVHNDEVLPAPIRTTTARIGELHSPVPAATPGRGWHRTSSAFGFVAVLTVSGAMVFRAAANRGGMIAMPPAVLTDSSVRDSALSSLAGGPVPDPALVAYRTAIRLWLDASGSEAKRTFHEATALSPDFAAAHLWYVLATDYLEADVRAHYASAVRYRDSLTELQRRVLDALGPSMGDPADLSATATRLARLMDETPDSIELRLVLASRYHRLGDKQRGLDVIAGIVTQRSPPNLAFYIRALLVSLDNDVTETRAALRECLERPPVGADCLYDLWLTESNEGECEKLEPICRQFMIVAPDKGSPYKCLADAISSTGGSSAAIESAYAKRERRSSPDDRVRAEDQVHLAIAEGRLADADVLASGWQHLLAQSDRTIEPALVYILRTELAIELGDSIRAVALSREFQATSRSWPQSNFVDLDATYVALASAAGALTQADRRPLRERIIASSADASYGWAARRWLNAYIDTSWTFDEAQDAMAHMPNMAISGPQYTNAYDDYNYGRVFALAGRPDEAKRFFSRAGRSCSLEWDFYRTRAQFELARLSEGQKARACELYEKVALHWAKTPHSATVSAARARVSALGCH